MPPHHPLTNLLRSNKLQWSTIAEATFTILRRKMTETPILCLPDFTQTFILETNVSIVAVGAVLSQQGHPITFFSKYICNRLQASSLYVREMYAMIEAIKKWREYLIGRHFDNYIDKRI